MKLTSLPAIDILATGLVQVAAPSGEQQGAVAAGEADEVGLLPDDDAILAAYAARLRPGGADD